MGQLIFIPSSAGGGGGGAAATVVQGFVRGVGDLNAYVLAGAGAADFLTGNAPFSVGAAFRMLHAEGTQTIATCTDGATSSWALDFDAGARTFSITLDADVGKQIVTDASDIPIGRMVFLTASYDGADLTFYVDGTLIDTLACAANADVGGTTFLLAGGDPLYDNFANLGFFFSTAAFTQEQHENLVVASQDAARMVLPAALQALGDFAVYNAETGLSVITTWDPEAGNTLGATVPLVTAGAPAVPTLDFVPFSLGVALAGGGGGGASTGANVGTGPGEVYRDNTGAVLNLRTIINNDGTLLITTVGDEIVIDQNNFEIASFAKTAPGGATLTYLRGDTLTGTAVAATYTDGPPTSASLSNTLGGSVGGGDVNPGAWTFVAPYAVGTQPVNVKRDGTDLGADPTWTIGLSATNGLVDTASVIVRWTSYIYYGASALAGPLTDAQIVLLPTSVLSGTRGRTLSITLASEYFYYCYPTGLGAASYTLYGFAVDMQATYTVNITNANGIIRSYNVDRSTYALTGTNLPIIVS